MQESEAIGSKGRGSSFGNEGSCEVIFQPGWRCEVEVGRDKY